MTYAPRFFACSSLLLLVCVGACGGKVVAEDDEGSGSTGSSTGSSTSSATSGSTSASTSGVTTTTSTGGGPCDDHGDCPGGVCIFSTGVCATSCGESFCESCGPGSFCNGCATSSCPKCDD